MTLRSDHFGSYSRLSYDPLSVSSFWDDIRLRNTEGLSM